MERFGNHPARGARRGVAVLLLPVLLATVQWLGAPSCAYALLNLDFEQKYYVHPQRQVWDFSLIRSDSLYYLFYHSILESTPNASRADTIWQASSADLRRWNDPVPILFSGTAAADTGAIWAPDVFRDDENNRWMMAYTGCDIGMNQRMLMAESSDLVHWNQVPENPVIVPDTLIYLWDSEKTWSDFRDPFVYRQDSQWHVLLTARQYLATNTGVVFHAVTDDLLDWQDVGYFFANDGDTPAAALESPQYFVRGQYHHLLVGEFDDTGVTLLSASSPDNWTMSERVMIEEGGYAPEVVQFDPGHDIYGRIAPYYPIAGDTSVLAYVARFDTLLTDPDGGNPTVYRPHPLEQDWESWSGISNLANPTFGDNPAARGDESCGLIGHGFYGSQEYYMGPLSKHGMPGLRLGDSATGTLTSRPFVITGVRMELLVGGGEYPETCYVALVSAADSTIWYSETGTGQELMTPRTWDLRRYMGQTARIVIVDQETALFGHINVDEIHEIALPVTAVADPPPAAGTVLRHRASPNPFNPVTRILFTLEAAAAARVQIHDLRGRLVWDSGVRSAAAGENSITWQGRSSDGKSVAAGSYLYRLRIDGSPAVSGKLMLID